MTQEQMIEWIFNLFILRTCNSLINTYYLLLNIVLIKQIARVVCLKTLECNFPSASGINQTIRTGNVVALDMAIPQLAVHHDPRADD